MSKLWIYPELRLIKALQNRHTINELKTIINSQFHGGIEVRTDRDIEKIMKGRTILNK